MLFIITLKDHFMNTHLTQYLSNVFRNEVQSNAKLRPEDHGTKNNNPLIDPTINQFIVDKKFSLKLDEIA